MYADQASAQAFAKCAECVPEEAANYLTEAGNSIRKTNSADAVNFFNQAVGILAKAGRISMAARLRKQIAEIYEQDEVLELSAQNYQEAADLFEMDNGESTANQCLIKVAELLTLNTLEPSTVLRAIKIYDQVGTRYLSHNLTKFSAKDLFFRVGVLHLAIDVRAKQDTVGAETCLRKYINADPSFETSRECKLVMDLLAALRTKRVNEFEDAVFNFNRITPLDRWKTHVLLKAKTHLEQGDEVDNF